MKVADVNACLNVYDMGDQVHAEPCEIAGDTPSQWLELSDDGLLKWGVEVADASFSEHVDPEGRTFYYITSGPRQGESVWERPSSEGSRRACVAPAPSAPGAEDDAAPDLGAERVVSFAPCVAPDEAAKEGQAFARANTRADGAFELREAGSPRCLSHDGFGATLLSTPCTGDSKQTWRFEAGQLRSDAADVCLDGNDRITPALYPCHLTGTLDSQRLRLHENGWVELRRSFGDNGRIRLPARCLDSRPVPPVAVTVVDCREAEAAGSRWERIWLETPMERRLFQELELRRRQ